MHFVVKNEIHVFTPKLSVILADMVEAVHLLQYIFHQLQNDLVVIA